jgi:hypothetical protein
MRSALIAVIAVIGCSSNGDNGSTGDAAPQSCEAIADQLEELTLRPGGSCTTDADCVVVGGQLSTTPTCDCAPFMLSCGGVGVEQDDPYLDQIRELEQAYRTRGCNVDRWASLCDCAPSEITCGEHRRCVTREKSCLAP